MRVVIAEDFTLLREGLVRLLEGAGIEVVAALGSADGLAETVREYRPDLVLLDVRMPPTHTDEGLQAALRLDAEHPEVALLILSQAVEERYATELLGRRTSAVGYLLKDRVADVEDFLAVLTRVAAGGTALDPEVVSQLLVRRNGSSSVRAR